MHDLNDSRLARAWDAEYASGRRDMEQPLKFTADIIRELKNHLSGDGLYVGCGSGRNYVPLAETGLNMVGLDISPVALAMLSEKLPQCRTDML